MTATNSTPRENMVRRIKALLAKTIENGATEAEAMSALAKAQEMMQAHGLDREAIDAEAFVKDAFAKQASRQFSWAHELCYGVSLFTGTFSWLDRNAEGGIKFAGRESDVIFAAWLIDALDGFVNRQALSYAVESAAPVIRDAKRSVKVWGQGDLFGGGTPRASVPSTRRVESDRKGSMRDFSLGVCARIGQRLVEMADADAKRRHHEAKRQLERDGMGFGKSSSRGPTISNAAAFAAGMARGDGAAFNRPMGGSRGYSAPAQIGHG